MKRLMSPKKKFIMGIVAPSFSAIVLFVLILFGAWIPQFEKRALEQKKETTRELTHSVIGLLTLKHQQVQQGQISLTLAKAEALSMVEAMRYGPENKDYFWVIDQSPKMLMHPYRKDLEGQNLQDFQDAHHKRLFVEASRLASEQQFGFVEYYWQWKDVEEKVVPKVSYVQAFEPWSWVVGTGIYLNDVEKEVSDLNEHLWRVTLAITAFISFLILMVIRQSFGLDLRRRSVERQLLASKQRVKNLLDSSSGGAMWISSGMILDVNRHLARWLNLERKELSGASFDRYFEPSWSTLLEQHREHQGESMALQEVVALAPSGQSLKMLLSIADFSNVEESSCFVSLRAVQDKDIFWQEQQRLSDELQWSLQLMKQPIAPFLRPLSVMKADEKIETAIAMMNEQDLEILSVESVAHDSGAKLLGVVDDHQLRKEVLASGKTRSGVVGDICTRDEVVIERDALLFEALRADRKVSTVAQGQRSRLLVKDDRGRIDAYLRLNDLLAAQQNLISHLIIDIEQAKSVAELREHHARLPALVYSMAENSEHVKSMTRLISTMADAITVKVIQMAMSRLGPAPCRFAFVALGSEGRMEQTLKTDQDNAVIFEKDGDEIVDAYFLSLGVEVSQTLADIGYELCDGGIMAMNPKWCRSMASWQRQSASWAKDLAPLDVFDASILLDLRCVYGEHALVDEWRKVLQDSFDPEGGGFSALADQILCHPLEPHAVEQSFKKCLSPMVATARLYAFHERMLETHSIDRTLVLASRSRDSGDELRATVFESTLEVYKQLLALRLSRQAKAMCRGETLESKLDVEALSAKDRALFEQAWHVIAELHQMLRRDF